MTTSGALEELARQLPSVPSGIFALAERTIDWSRSIGAFTPGLDVRVPFAASVFAGLCAPPSAEAHQLDVAARLLAVFLLFDDRDVRHVRPKPFLAESKGGQILDVVPGLRSWLDEFRPARICSPRRGDAFMRSLEDYLAARGTEIEAVSSARSMEECRALRARTFFAAPWMEHWLISMGIDDVAFDEAPVRRCSALATELAYTLNDLVSHEKDGSDGGASRDLNVVRTHQRLSGCSSNEAIDHFVGLHNALAEEYGRAITRARRGASGSVHCYLELLTWAVVEGNKRAHEALARVRYGEQARPILARLASVLGPGARAGDEA